MKGRCLNKPQAEEVLRLLITLQESWGAGYDSKDKWVALDWLEEAIDELYLDFPRVAYLNIYMREVESRAPRAREVRDQIDAIWSLLVT